MSYAAKSIIYYHNAAVCECQEMDKKWIKIVVGSRLILKHVYSLSYI